MTFAQERGNNSRDEKQKQPGRKCKNADRKGNRRNGSLQQLTKGPNHPNPVRGLVPGALQLVVKLRVLVRGNIKTRRVLHHADADVASKAVHKNAVAVIAKTRHDAADES